MSRFFTGKKEKKLTNWNNVKKALTKFLKTKAKTASMAPERTALLTFEKGNWCLYG